MNIGSCMHNIGDKMIHGLNYNEQVSKDMLNEIFKLSILNLSEE